MPLKSPVTKVIIAARSHSKPSRFPARRPAAVDRAPRTPMRLLAGWPEFVVTSILFGGVDRPGRERIGTSRSAQLVDREASKAEAQVGLDSEGSRVGHCQICEKPAHAVLVAKRCKGSHGWRREHGVIRGKE